MENKLTYKLNEIIAKNRYTELIIKNKKSEETTEITDVSVRFRYEPQSGASYLCFGSQVESTVCEVHDENINEVIIDTHSITIETDQTSYYCYIDKEQLYY